MDGILLVAHGSKSDNRYIEHLAQRVHEQSGIPTALGYKRFGEPKIRHALKEVSGAGVSRLAVIPLFMSDGRYVQSIPRNLGLGTDSSSGTVNCGGCTMMLTVSSPIGLDVGIGDVVLSMVRDACSEDPTETGVALIGHGTTRDGTDPTAGILDNAGYRTAWVTGNPSEDLMPAIAWLRSDGCRAVVAVPMRMSPLRIRPAPDVIVTAPAGTSEGVARIVCRMAADILG